MLSIFESITSEIANERETSIHEYNSAIDEISNDIIDLVSGNMTKEELTTMCTYRNAAIEIE